jgi:tetratricopeptide (TPR) repeat protein
MKKQSNIHSIGHRPRGFRYPRLSKVTSWFTEGLAQHQAGRLADAEKIYNKILALQPDHFDSLHLLGVIFHQRGDYAEAVHQIGLALKRDPNNIIALNNRGVAFQELKRFDEALASYNRALAIRPDYAEALSNRGHTLNELERFEEALASCDHALALQPNHAAAHLNRGVSLHKLKRFEEALMSFDRALVVWPDFAEALSNRGNTLKELKRFEEALMSFDRALAVRPDYAEALSNRGNVMKELKRFEEALASYDRALAVRPDFAEALSNRGLVLHELRRCEEALASYDRALTLQPDFADAHHNHGVTLKSLGRLAEARRAVERAIQLAPQNPSHFLNLSEVYQFVAGDPHVAMMEDLARNIESLPVEQQIELHFALAKAYEDIGHRNESFRQLLVGNALKRRHINYDETKSMVEFENFTAAFTPELMWTFQHVGVPSSAPLFIIGMPRSGTTLIEQILASHPRVFGAGELPNLDNAVDSMRSTGGITISFRELMLNISGEHLQQLGARYVFEITRLAPNATYITDKMPSNFFFVGLIHLALPNAHIIHVNRDPVDTCLSCFSTLFADGNYHAYDLSELGRYYRRYQTLMQHWHRILPPGRILDVRYEDVVADLEGQARRIIAHCGLDWDRRCLDFHESKRPVHTASVAQVRRPIYSSSVGRWRAYEPFLRPLLAELSVDWSGM